MIVSTFYKSLIQRKLELIILLLNANKVKKLGSHYDTSISTNNGNHNTSKKHKLNGSEDVHNPIIIISLTVVRRP